MKPTQKIDYRKQNKEIYQAKQDKFSELIMPNLQFLMISGAGDPNNSSPFKESCEALFAVSYKIKFSIKKSELDLDYAVMPLEGLWWVDGGEFSLKDKKNWKWTLMVRQPDFVTEQHLLNAIDEVAKKSLTCLSDLSLRYYEEGLSVQTLHIGPYSEEQKTIDQLHNYIKNNNHQFHGKHHEIYLNDPTRTDPDKLKTIIRQPIQ